MIVVDIRQQDVNKYKLDLIAARIHYHVIAGYITNLSEH